MSRSSKTIATDEATGQSRLEKNSSQRTLPIIIVSEPPNREGITNSPKAGMKTRKQPAIIPGFDKGAVINQNADIAEQPRLR